jgi:hypothetical protein
MSESFVIDVLISYKCWIMIRENMASRPANDWWWGTYEARLLHEHPVQTLDSSIYGSGRVGWDVAEELRLESMVANDTPSCICLTTALLSSFPWYNRMPRGLGLLAM